MKVLYYKKVIKKAVNKMKKIMTSMNRNAKTQSRHFKLFSLSQTT
jgi:3-oxoacyl-[acyl-carrier-protein] synthase III